MPVPTSIADLSTTASSNYPSGSESIGTSLDDYIRSTQAIVKQQDSKRTGITAAGTITVPTDGSYFIVTGNTTITTIADSWNGRTVKLKFSGTPQLTHSSGLILPGAANLPMAAGDVIIVTNESTGVWRVLVYQPAAGNITGSAIGVSVQAYDANLASLAGLTLAQGDILVATGVDTVARLAKGTASQQLRINAGETAPEWFTPAAVSGITLGTPVATTSGTSVDITGIPSTAKRVTINLNGVSTTGTSQTMIQLGDSGGVETTGYVGSNVDSNFSAGFVFSGALATCTRYGSLVLTLENASTNTWCCSGVVGRSDNTNADYVGGRKALSATLDRVRITTVGGSDTFDAGEINIAYE